MPINYLENQKYPTSVKEMIINGNLLNASSFYFSSFQCFQGIQIYTHTICVLEVQISKLLFRSDLKH